VCARTLATVDYGASAMIAGAGGALVTVVRDRWFTAGAVAIVVGGLFVHGEIADWEHFAAFPVGVLAGFMLGRPRRRPRAEIAG